MSPLSRLRAGASGGFGRRGCRLLPDGVQVATDLGHLFRANVAEPIAPAIADVVRDGRDLPVTQCRADAATAPLHVADETAGLHEDLFAAAGFVLRQTGCGGAEQACGVATAAAERKRAEAIWRWGRPSLHAMFIRSLRRSPDRRAR
jgi:hypothetical protein